MKYNLDLHITELKQEDYKDEFTLDLAALVHIISQPLLRLIFWSETPDFRLGKDILFVGPQVSGTILNMIHTLVPQIEESEYNDVYTACQHAITEIYRDKIFTELRNRYTEAAEIDKSLVEVGELDADEVVEYTDEEIYDEVNDIILPGLAFINLAFYVTYKNEYDLLKLDDIHNTEFWYNQYIDLFIHNMNYLDFVTIL